MRVAAVAAFFAALLAWSLKHWHAVIDAVLIACVAGVLLFRRPTVVEVALIASLVGHHFLPAVAAAWAFFVAPFAEDD